MKRSWFVYEKNSDRSAAMGMHDEKDGVAATGKYHR